MRKFIYIIIPFLISQILIAEVLPAQLRNKLAQAYQNYTKIELRILDPLLDSEKWRFVKDSTVFLSSNESFSLMAKIYQVLKKPALAQKIYDQLMQSATLQKGVPTDTAQTNPILKSLVTFFDQGTVVGTCFDGAGGLLVGSVDAKLNTNCQFLLAFC